MADEDVNVREMVARLWEKADESLAEGEPVLAQLPDFRSPEHDVDLRYLNEHWQIDPAVEKVPDGPEWKTKAKDRMAATVFGVLDRYFTQEREFFAHGVRTSNLLAEWIARLAKEIRLVATDLNDESHRLRDRQDVLHRRLEVRVAELSARVVELESRL